jgi:nucleoporin GLE1
VIRQISGTKDSVSGKINDIVKIFKDPRCPVSISIAAFAKKVTFISGLFKIYLFIYC